MEISIKWNVCRICMEEESKSVTLRPIFEVPTLPNDIFLCSGVELKKTDNLPDKICQRCFSILKYATKFRITCQKTTEYLREIIQKTQTASNIFKSNKSNTPTEAEVTFENIDFLEEEHQTVATTDELIIDGPVAQIIESNEIQYVIQDVESGPTSAEQSPSKDTEEIPLNDSITIDENSQQTTEFQPDCSNSIKGSEEDQYDQDYELSYFSEEDIKQEVYEVPDEVEEEGEESQSMCETMSQINDYAHGEEEKGLTAIIKDEDFKAFPRKYSQRAKDKGSDFMCDICGNHFKKKCLLSFHMRIHKNEKNFECEICSKRFNSPWNLRAHIRVHTGEKPFQCKFCERKFADRSTQIKHERIHTNEKPYSCTTCGKCFSLTTSLKAHEKMHTGERPYKCEPCSKAFTLPHQLKAHLQTNMHRIVSEL